MEKRIDPFGKGYGCYKANLHAHTTASDGKFSLRELSLLYRDKGYDVLAITDHYKANCLSSEKIDGLSLLSGIEFHPKGPEGRPLHIVALNVPEDFSDPSGFHYQDAIDAVIAAGGECIMAHPYWNGNSSEEIFKIKNLMAVEVYNYDTRLIGREFSEVVWDELLQKSRRYGAVAVDDTHRSRDLFGGWTMISAPDSSPSSIINSLREGLYYATTGPEFHRIELEKKNLSGKRKFIVECTPVEELIFIGPPSFGITETYPGLGGAVSNGGFTAADNAMATSFEALIPDDLPYIRCRVKDGKGKYAWTNPYYLNE